MKLPEALFDVLNYVKSIFNYSQTCIALPLNTFNCKNFWLSLDSALMAIVVYVLIHALVFIFRKNKAQKNYLKMLEERAKVADEETMNKTRWAGDNSGIDDISQEDTAELIRQNLKAKKE